MSTRSITKNGVSFVVEGSTKDWILYEENLWETNTFLILDKVLKPSHNVVDIGAWIGPISLYVGSKVNKCYSFEPDPVAYNELKRNISHNPQLAIKIDANNLAITSTGEPVKLYSRFAHGDSGSSLLKRVKSANAIVEAESVSLPEFLEKKGVSKIDFIKMDIEGGEFFLIPHLVGYLNTNHPTLLVSFHFEALCEFVELSYLPFGFLRRILRKLDSERRLIKLIVNRKIQMLIKSLDFYKIYNEDLSRFDPNAKNLSYEKIDMLLFTVNVINP